MGSYFPDQGIEPMAPCIESTVLTTGPPGKSPFSFKWLIVNVLWVSTQLNKYSQYKIGKPLLEKEQVRAEGRKPALWGKRRKRILEERAPMPGPWGWGRRSWEGVGWRMWEEGCRQREQQGREPDDGRTGWVWRTSGSLVCPMEMFRWRKKSELRLQRRAKWDYPGIYSPKLIPCMGLLWSSRKPEAAEGSRPSNPVMTRGEALFQHTMQL